MRTDLEIRKVVECRVRNCKYNNINDWELSRDIGGICTGNHVCIQPNINDMPTCQYYIKREMENND